MQLRLNRYNTYQNTNRNLTIMALRLIHLFFDKESIVYKFQYSTSINDSIVLLQTDFYLFIR